MNEPISHSNKSDLQTEKLKKGLKIIENLLHISTRYCSPPKLNMFLYVSVRTKYFEITWVRPRSLDM